MKLDLPVTPCQSQIEAATFTVEKDIAFLGTARSESMDAYIPSADFARPLPAVIWIHGGAWVSGGKAMARERNVCGTLAQNGYAAFSIDYQLGNISPADIAGGVPDDPVPWPQNFYDCKSALRFIRRESSRFGIDPLRVAVSGGSAGGHLALLVGSTGNHSGLNQNGLHIDQANSVSCIIDFYGVPEIIEPWTRSFQGASLEETKANMKAASVSTYLSPSTPPILIVHGTADPLVDIRVSRDLADRLAVTGIVHDFVEVSGAGHAFDVQPREMDLRPVVLAFLARYLGNPKYP